MLKKDGMECFKGNDDLSVDVYTLLNDTKASLDSDFFKFSFDKVPD